MKVKRTLSIDEELVRFAHSQAQLDSTSVSSMFSQFLEARKIQSDRKAIPSVSAIIGSLKSYIVDNSKAAIREHYADKHHSRCLP